MDTIKISFQSLIDYLNNMYSEEGKSPAFVQYINRLLERGGDCYKILNALTYHISDMSRSDLDSDQTSEP